MQNQDEVDYFALANKLQIALAKAYVDYQDLEKDLKYFSQKGDVLEAQIEIKQAYIDRLELNLAHRKAKEEGIFRDDDESVEDYLQAIREKI